jgi:RNA polymerase sigma factor (sigma-70 family)
MASNDLATTNFEQLRGAFFRDTGASAAVDLIFSVDDSSLSRILQTHWFSEPEPDQIDVRDGVDFLLDYFSVIEIGSLCNALPNPLPRDFQAIASTTLNRRPVWNYYSRLAPLALPQLLRRRLEGKPARLDSHLFIEFSSFLNLSAMRRTEAVYTFLWMVEGGRTFDGFYLRDVLRLFAETERLATVALSPSKGSGLDNGLRGLLEFLSFARSYDSFLQGCSSKPMLQSACWHYHGYWFRQIGIKIAGVLAGVIEELRPQVDEPARDIDASHAQDTYASMDAAHTSLQRLVSGLYSLPIDTLLLSSPQPEPEQSRRTPVTGAGIDYQRVLVEHLDLIAQIVRTTGRRRHLSSSEREDFASFVHLRLIEDDYAILRKFQNRTSLWTYLAAVIERLSLDFCAEIWGRWRPSAIAERIGPVAVMLERLVTRESHTLEEAIEILITNHEVDLSSSELRNIWNQLPARVRNTEVGENVADSISAGEQTDHFDDAHRQKRTEALQQALETAFQRITPQDRLLVALRFDHELSMVEIAKLTGSSVPALHRRLDKSMKELRLALSSGGFDPREVTDLIGHSSITLAPLLRAEIERFLGPARLQKERHD